MGLFNMRYASCSFNVQIYEPSNCSHYLLLYCGSTLFLILNDFYGKGTDDLQIRNISLRYDGVPYLLNYCRFLLILSGISHRRVLYKRFLIIKFKEGKRKSMYPQPYCVSKFSYCHIFVHKIIFLEGIMYTSDILMVCFG